MLEEGACVDEIAACGCVQSSVDELELYILGDDRLGRPRLAQLVSRFVPVIGIEAFFDLG